MPCNAANARLRLVSREPTAAMTTFAEERHGSTIAYTATAAVPNIPTRTGSEEAVIPDISVRRSFRNVAKRLAEGSQKIASVDKSAHGQRVHRILTRCKPMPHDITANKIPEGAKNLVVAGTAGIGFGACRCEIGLHEIVPSHVWLDVHSCVFEIFCGIARVDVFPIQQCGDGAVLDHDIVLPGISMHCYE